MKNGFGFLFLYLLITVCTFGESFDGFSAGISYNGVEFPTNHFAREEMRDIITAPTAEVLRAVPKILSQKGEQGRVLFQVKEQGDSYYLLFTNEKNYKFPLYSAGSYIIKRNRDDGKFTQVKIFTRTHPGCFVRVFPRGERIVMDVYLFHHPLYQNIIIAQDFHSVLTSSFDRIMRSTERSIDWPLIVTAPSLDDYSLIASMIKDIRKSLSSLKDEDDGALNQEGEFVFIEDLSKQETDGFNCSGFVKWIADGIAYRYTGSYLSIEDLKTKHVNSRGNRWTVRYENRRDPYFGLDWTRNLAVTLEAMRTGAVYFGPESSDIRNVPFFAYIEDVGYSIEDLEPILYFLAVKHPNRFYFGSVNSEFGRNPPLRQHHHVVSLFPFFDANGNFEIAVFERNVETDIESLRSRYKEEFIHLVAVEAPEDYQPVVIP